MADHGSFYKEKWGLSKEENKWTQKGTFLWKAFKKNQ